MSERSKSFFFLLVNVSDIYRYQIGLKLCLGSSWVSIEDHDCQKGVLGFGPMLRPMEETKDLEQYYWNDREGIQSSFDW